MKVGIIQSQGIGDIIIALPIAKWYADRGAEVFWPVNEIYAGFAQMAAPYVSFLPQSAAPGQDFVAYSYDTPLSMLRQAGCEKVMTLNMNLPDERTIDRRLATSLKFDEYKYAVAHVPFAEKWSLALTRDIGRERALHGALGLDGREYICLHFEGSSVRHEVTLPPEWLERYRIVQIQPVTDSPFDWIYTIERAARRVMVDSMFANLTEQLGIGGANYLIQRSVTALTPVYRNGWTFCWPGDTISEAA